MPDYNIYIHSANGSSSSPTKPWHTGNTQTSSLNEDTNSSLSVANRVISVYNYAQNPDSLLQKGANTIEKAVPWIAAAKFVVSSVDNAITSVVDYNALETGDYRGNVNWSNLKNVFHYLTHPFGTLTNHIRITNRIRLENYRRSEHRMLLGDSDINSYTNRGV